MSEKRHRYKQEVALYCYERYNNAITRKYQLAWLNLHYWANNVDYGGYLVKPWRGK